jgi:hypothetical protein
MPGGCANAYSALPVAAVMRVLFKWVFLVYTTHNVACLFGLVLTRCMHSRTASLDQGGRRCWFCVGNGRLPKFKRMVGTDVHICDCDCDCQNCHASSSDFIGTRTVYNIIYPLSLENPAAVSANELWQCAGMQCFGKVSFRFAFLGFFSCSYRIGGKRR